MLLFGILGAMVLVAIVIVQMSKLNAIKEILSTPRAGQDCCWYEPDTLEKISKVVGVQMECVDVPPRDAFERGCAAYAEKLYGPRDPYVLDPDLMNEVTTSISEAILRQVIKGTIDAFVNRSLSGDDLRSLGVTSVHLLLNDGWKSIPVDAIEHVAFYTRTASVSFKDAPALQAQFRITMEPTH